MPNWCGNSITINVKNTKEVRDFLKEVEKAFIEERFNSYFVPRIENYSQNKENWGTKWEISPADFSYHSVNLKELKVHISFDTAWSPNIPVSQVFYDRLNKIGDIKQYLHEYFECGNAFYGRFNGKFDDCRDINILYYILNGSQSSLSLESQENNILKFEDIDSLFIIKSSSEEKMYYYDDSYTVKVYKCFSETFGEDILIYEYDDFFYSYNIR